MERGQCPTWNPGAWCVVGAQNIPCLSSPPLLPQHGDKCPGLAGVSKPMKTAPSPRGWKSVQDVLKKRARDRGLWSVSESRGQGRPDSFQKLLGRMTSSRAAAVACGSASLGPAVSGTSGSLGPAGRVGWGGVGWARPGMSCTVPGGSAVKPEGGAASSQPRLTGVQRRLRPNARDTREPAAQHTWAAPRASSARHGVNFTSRSRSACDLSEACLPQHSGLVP